jgi:hypothetical protein
MHIFAIGFAMLGQTQLTRLAIDLMD